MPVGRGTQDNVGQIRGYWSHRRQFGSRASGRAESQERDNECEVGHITFPSVTSDKHTTQGRSFDTSSYIFASSFLRYRAGSVPAI